MQYLDIVHKIKEIEKIYDVLSLRYKGIPIWPLLRIYFWDSLADRPREAKASGSVINVVLKSLFTYNPFKIFGKYKFWILAGRGTRKQVGDYQVQRIAGLIPKIEERTLLLERPEPRIPNCPAKEVEESNIVSDSWFLLFGHLIEKIWGLFEPKLKVDNREILEEIIRETGVKFNYSYYIRYMFVQKRLMDMVLAIGHTPEVAFLQAPYNKIGQMLSLRNHGAKIIELQHGVLNKDHIAYNSSLEVPLFKPDKIFVFGDREYDFFTKDNKHYAGDVKITGLYILELSNQFFSKDLFLEIRKAYKKIIVVAGQDVYDEHLIPMTKLAAAELPEYFFIYIPRTPMKESPFDEKNIEYAANVNIYEYLKWCDVHCTGSSTTCLEAHYFGKPTVFLNINNVAKSYYEDLLNEEYGGIYIDDIKQITTALKTAMTLPMRNREIYASNCYDKMKKAIESI